jgi:hypothetical protein
VAITLASTLDEKVVYTVVIVPEEQPEGVRLGMSAEVEMATGRAAPIAWRSGLVRAAAASGDLTG